MTDGASSRERPVVITGAGGFVGRLLVRRLMERGHDVIGIGRGAQPADWPSDARWVHADLANVGDYEAALAGAACVLHLAAVTGKAKREAYRAGNVEATRALLGACVRAGVARFVFVSSIAATFKDRRHYPYADSKIAAEALVRDAALASVIVRPTMILGPSSPIQESLGKLARLPVSPIFGDGRRQVQPIDVADVVELLANLVRETNISGETIEIGGADTYDLRGLYARLRAKGAPRFVHLPLGLSRWGLALIEKPLLPLMPLTAGQLATFANDSVAAPHAAAKRLLPNPRPAPRPVAISDENESPPDRGALATEFKRNARYVAGAEPTAYQVSKYLDFHERRSLKPANAFDALLLRVSRFGGIGLALADSYSGLLYRTSVVRAKLVLALAILEASPPSFAALDKPDPGGSFVYVGMALRGAMAAFSFAIAAIFLLPAHFFFGLAGRLAASR